ncbi:alanine racemase [Bacillus niameyensis]|uniref:alanine racemase n=1 Tax=Bacillus niameyensis TaxID=1522308 RepID=UPI001E3930A5|nr:alanine racemase [Bacillus niameyensis]
MIIITIQSKALGSDSFVEEFYRDTWAEINLDAIFYNLTEIRNQLPNDTKVFVAVKANGYGHGDVQVARTVLAAGAHGLLVAFLDEALALRDSGITAPILVLGATRPKDAGIAAEKNISLTVFQHEWLLKAEESITTDTKLHVHIKCDTGMNRIGIKEENELQQIEDALQQSDSFYFEGIFTHFATADQVEDSYYKEQLTRFKHFLKMLKAFPPYVHAANSAAALVHIDSIFNAVRIGIAAYGLSPSEEIKTQLPFKLKEAFSLKTKITYIKKLIAGEKVGYGATYTANEEEWLATIPIGYADGWIRRLQGMKVLANGEMVPIVGRICMDQTMIRLPRHIPVGTTIILIGCQQGQSVSVDDIANKLGTINYEVTCTISNRVPRVYIVNGSRISSNSEIIAENFKKISN